MEKSKRHDRFLGNFIGRPKWKYATFYIFFRYAIFDLDLFFFIAFFLFIASLLAKYLMNYLVSKAPIILIFISNISYDGKINTYIHTLQWPTFGEPVVPDV